MSDSLQPHGLQHSGLFCSWDSPGKNTGVGFHFLLQEISLSQGSNPGLSHCRQSLYHLSHQGSGDIMRNARLYESLDGSGIVGRNINNLGYADDTTVMEESKEELKNLFMKMKEES